MKCRRDGFVLLGVLVSLALITLFAAAAGQRLADRRQRDAEAELLFVGEQYRQAIASYWAVSPGGVHTLPTRVEDLLLDSRFPQPRRHLRRPYADPLAPKQPWGLVRSGVAILGVFSQAAGEPFRQSGFDDAERDFEGARSYAGWRFTFRAPNLPPLGGTTSESKK